MSTRLNKLIVLFRSSISSICSIIMGGGVIKFPAMIGLSISPFSSDTFAYCVLKLCYWVHILLGLLCLPMNWPFSFL